MKLEVKREFITKNNTIGSLFINGKFFCYTLEDIPRDKKVQNATCIPFGIYDVAVTMSTRFKKRLPLVYNKPSNYTVVASNGDSWAGIRFHGGNTEADTDGCILVAKNRYIKDGTIQGSMSDELSKLLDNGEIHTLTITK